MSSFKFNSSSGRILNSKSEVPSTGCRGPLEDYVCYDLPTEHPMAFEIQSEMETPNWQY